MVEIAVGVMLLPIAAAILYAAALAAYGLLHVAAWIILVPLAAPVLLIQSVVRLVRRARGIEGEWYLGAWVMARIGALGAGSRYEAPRLPVARTRE